MYVYHNKEGLVKMVTSKKLKKADRLWSEKIKTTKEEAAKMKQNYLMSLKDGKITFEAHPRLEYKLKKERAKKRSEKLTSLLEGLERAESVSGAKLKEILYNLIEDGNNA